MPEISVIMPCFNAASSVARAIESIQQQSYPDWELVVVDDGSTDESAHIVASLASKDARIKLIRQPHGGVVSASQNGFSHARGNFIARMDADDVSLPLRLEKQHKTLLKDSGLDAVSCLVRFAGDPQTAGGYAHHVDWTNQLTTEKDIALQRFIDLPVPHPTLMYRRRTFERFGGYRDGSFPEDYELILRWIDQGARIGKVPEVLFEWHDPPTRLSRNDSRYDMSAFHACKAPFLANAIRRTAPSLNTTDSSDLRELWIWGAGRPARKCARPLETTYRPASGFIDIDPRKIGRLIQSRPVVSHHDLPPSGTSVIVAYVASRGAGDTIRAELLAAGRTEGVDFWIAA